MTKTQVRTLSEADLDGLFAIRQVAYHDTSDFSDKALRERHTKRLPYTQGVFVGDTLASAAIFLPFQMYFGGQLVRMGGLASVLTAPEHRRQGYVRMLLRDGLERLHADGVGWCLEYPFDPFYYQKFGWQSVPNGMRVKIPAQRLLREKEPVEVQRVTTQDEAVLERIKTIYHVWAEGYQFTLARDEAFRPDWRNTFTSPATGREHFVYLMPDAYCVTEIGHDPATGDDLLKVHDYAFTSPKGRRDLLTFWGGFYGQLERIEALLPTDDPLLLDIPGFYQPSTHPIQARVASVEHVLQGLRSKSSASFTLSIQDDFCPWNDETFRLELTPSGTAVTTTNEMAELSLDVRTLALLLSGCMSATAAHRAGLLEGELEHAQALVALTGGRTSFMSKVDGF